MGFRYTPIAGAAEAEGPHALRQGPFDPRTALVALLPLLTGIPGSSRLQRFKMLLRREMKTAPSVLGPGAEGPGLAGTAVLEAKADQGIGLALPIDVLPPHGRDVALRTVGLPLLPIDRELREIVGPVGMSLPALDRPRGAAERDAVVVPAGGEQGRADIGAIDEMLPWCQVFLAQSLVDGCGALGFIDCSGGRVHVREEMRHGRLTRLTD